MTDFYKHSTMSGGLQANCKTCATQLAKDRALASNIKPQAKECQKCREVKEPSEFARNVLGKFGLASYCKQCHKIGARARWVKYHYGLSEDEYEALLEKQNNCCAICSRDFSSLGKHPCVDHCHATGKVRGLLCAPCNHAIGLLQDSAAVVEAAARYLQQ